MLCWRGKLWELQRFRFYIYIYIYIDNQDQFNKLLNTAMTSLASQASDVPIGAKKFGTNKVNISLVQTLYSLVQCTPDLSSIDCNFYFLPICCGGKRGGRVLFPSCNIIYELYPFYNTPGLQPPPPPTSVGRQEGKVEHLIRAAYAKLIYFILHLINIYIYIYVFSSHITTFHTLPLSSRCIKKK